MSEKRDPYQRPKRLRGEDREIEKQDQEYGWVEVGGRAVLTPENRACYIMAVKHRVGTWVAAPERVQITHSWVDCEGEWHYRQEWVHVSRLKEVNGETLCAANVLWAS